MLMTYIQYITQFSRKKKDNVYQLHSNNIYQLYNSILWNNTKRKFHRNVCPRKLGFFIMTTLDIDKNRTIYVSDTSTTCPGMIGLLLSLSNSYSTHGNISQQVL